MPKIQKAVFPVAGLGSRFLPATKAQPKEMLPIVDKPLIQYAVEEAVAAGITEMVFITGRNKRAIEDHFDKAYELESELEAANKQQLLELVRNVIPKHVNCIYIRQSEPLGLGHAVLCARPVIGDEPFAVLLADDFMDTAEGVKPVLAQMTDLYLRKLFSMLAVQEVPRETRQYGIVSAQHYQPEAGTGAASSKSRAGRGAIDAGRGGPLRAVGRIFDLENLAREPAANPADRRHCRPDEATSACWPTATRPALRLRLQAGLPEGDDGDGHEASGNGAAFRAYLQQLQTTEEAQ
jgi:hypothetical protein